MPATETFLNEITLDQRLQFRQGKGPMGCDPDTIKHYAELMKEGTQFPPLLCVELTQQFEDHAAGTVLLVGGFTRYYAALGAGFQEYDTIIKTGTWNEAKILAYKENSEHGKARTQAEMRAVIRDIHIAYPDMSQRKVAEMAGVSHETVRKYIAELNPKPESEDLIKTPKPDTKTPKESPQAKLEDAPPFQLPESEDDPFADDDEDFVRVDDADDTMPDIDPWEGIKRDIQEIAGIQETCKRLVAQVKRGKNERDGFRAVEFGTIEAKCNEIMRSLLLTMPAYRMRDGLDHEDNHTAEKASKGHGWLTRNEYEKLAEKNKPLFEEL